MVGYFWNTFPSAKKLENTPPWVENPKYPLNRNTPSEFSRLAMPALYRVVQEYRNENEGSVNTFHFYNVHKAPA